ncbi:hypothetical protein [Duganella vulcania]|uniref:Uncharacterized protein n=1 Tax=Duganella vulcania TaxID=2692166 RepID=A0A845GGC5_9BURK|nr:hypothetical protein [Duganella vulcania]MYM92435.1 hypothetical protein [Duganella vulcania]
MMGVELTCWLPSLISQLLSCSELNGEAVSTETHLAIAFANVDAPPGEQMRRLLACAELSDGQVELPTSVVIARAQHALGMVVGPR